MLVVLRLCLGCHFLYEGIWKIEHRRAIGNEPKFSSRPFLTQAKGPPMPLFHAMLFDYQGRQRLKTDEVEKNHWTLPYYVKEWDQRYDRYVHRYGLQDAQAQALHKVLERYEKGPLEEFAGEHHAEIDQHFGSLDRLDAKRREPTAGVPFQAKRIWDWDQDLQKEVDGWLAELDKLTEAYHKDLETAFADVADEKRAKMGPLVPAWDPRYWTRDELIDFAVTWGLPAIGLCLFLGLCTRLAALGGAAFMVFVILTQFPWPTVYPPAPAVVGHALLVNKDFLEMVALLLVASAPVGRWGGLDFFLYRIFGRTKAGCCCQGQTPRA